MKKILFMVTKSENGGAQKWTKEQMDILSNDFELFLATDKNGWLVQNTNAKDSLIDFGIRSRTSFGYLMKVIKFIRDNKIDLIVASSANAGIYSRLAKLFTNTKVIYVGHGWSSIYNGGKLKSIYMIIEKILSTFTESILCISSSDFERAKNEIGIKEEKLKLLKNCILPMQQKSLPPKNDRIKILTVARFRAPKRNELLIQSMKDIDADLYLVGDGPLRVECEKYKTDQIHFLGEVDNFDAFNEYDIFALISDSEGMPLSAIEAMSAGLPLVLSNVGGCPELIDGNGILVENTIDSISNGLRNVIKNREKYAKKSLTLYEKYYNLTNNAFIYKNYYFNVIN